VAVIVAVPVVEGVKRPAEETVPIEVGLTDHVTAVGKAPVPETVAEQADVCEVLMDAGAQLTVTPVMVEED
jgi:hypothetical protein